MTFPVLTSSAPETVFPFLADHPQYDGQAKRENFHRLEEAREAGRLITGAAPGTIRLEPCAHCNLKCCWAQRDAKHPGLRERGYATPELAERIVEQIGETLYKVILCHWGEPLLNRELPALVRIFHDAGIYTTFDTNMTLMTEELAEQLVDAGLDAISASIDGVAQASYAKYRIGGQVDKTFEGLRMMLDARERRGRTKPRVRWQFLVFPHNEHEVDEAERLAREIGVDVFDVFGAGGRQWSRDQGFLPTPAPQRAEGLLCNDPWSYLAVDWDGGVQACCRAFQAKHLMGHMNDAPLDAIFDNERFQAARRVIRDGVWNTADGAIPCTGCNRVTLHVPEIRELGHTLSLDDPATSEVMTDLNIAPTLQSSGALKADDETGHDNRNGTSHRQDDELVRSQG